ncbi:MAG: response regulator, partial [Saccharothrix sp.]|nr:response regulator [Saccharothrix sp.]
MRVLVVDDDEAVRRSLAHALRRDGYQVSLAADGAQALDELSRTRPEVI